MNSNDSFSVAGSELRPYLKVSTSRWHIVFCVCWEAVLIILALSVSLGLFGLGFLILIYIITEKWMNLYILRDRANQKRYPAVEPLPTEWSKHIICIWNLLILFTCISFKATHREQLSLPGVSTNALRDNEIGVNTGFELGHYDRSLDQQLWLKINISSRHREARG